MAFRGVGDAEALALGVDSPRPERLLKCRTRDFVRTVDPIFWKSLSCLGGLIPGCPFRPLGKERGGQITNQSLGIGAVTTHPHPPPA